MGQNKPQRRQSPEDGAGWDKHTDRLLDGQIPPVSYRITSPSGPLPKTDLKWTEMAQNDQNVKILLGSGPEWDDVL